MKFRSLTYACYPKYNRITDFSFWMHDILDCHQQKFHFLVQEFHVEHVYFERAGKLYKSTGRKIIYNLYHLKIISTYVA